MGKLIHSPYQYGPVDVQALAKNWRVTAGGSEVRKGNNAKAVQAVLSAVNRLAGRCPRPWFWMAQPILSSTTIQADDTGSAELYATKYYDGVPNARNWTARLISLPRTAGSGDCYADESAGGRTPDRGVVVPSLNLCTDVFEDSFVVARGAAGDAETAQELNTYNGYTVLDVVYQDDPIKTLDLATHDCVDPDLVKPGMSVLEDALEDIRAVLHALRTENLPVVLQWHAMKVAGSWGTPASTDETGIVCSDTDWTNMQDTGQTLGAAPHTRTADSPGILIPAYKIGRGNESKTAGASARVTFRVLAKAVTQDCTVRFQGPDHVATNYTDMSWTAGAGVSWQGTDSDYVDLDTDTIDTDVTTGRNKVDGLLRTDVAGGTLTVYAAVGWIIWS